PIGASVVLFTSFFFSSRRRHTRLQGDWSSDVCSSDLIEIRAARGRGGRGVVVFLGGRRHQQNAIRVDPEFVRHDLADLRVHALRSEERRVGKEYMNRPFVAHIKRKDKNRVRFMRYYAN